MQRKITTALCCGVLLASLVTLWLRFKPETVTVNHAEILGVNTGLGQVLADETAKAVRDKGRVVPVTMYTPIQQSDYVRTAFDSELKKHTSISVTATEGVKFELDGGRPFWPRGAFKDLLERHADADAIVFFVDLPEWITVAESIPQGTRPKLIAIDNLGALTKIHYGGFFTSGILAALIGRPSQPVVPSQPKTPREWFDTRYQVYTPQNYDTLPE